MSEHTQRRRHWHTTAKAEENPSEVIDGQRTSADPKSEIDALIDEIDKMLEENALEILNGYRQRNGE